MSNSISIPQKECTRCHRMLDATSENFAPQKGGRYGLYSRCRQCARELAKEFQQSEHGKEIRRAYDKNPKRKNYLRNYYCSDKAKEKEAERRQRPDRQQYQAEYRSRDDVKVRQKELQNTPEAKQRIRIREQSSHRIKQKHINNSKPEQRIKSRARRDKRRIRVKNAGGHYTSSDIKAQLEAQENMCFYCGIRLFEDDYTIDHYVPLVRGGTNDPENIVLACHACNMSKGTSLESEWRERRGW